MSIYIRTKVTDGKPTTTNATHKVKGYQTIGGSGNADLTEQEYVERFGVVGDYILEIKGQVVEEETFEDRIVPGFTVGHMYSDHRGLMAQCAFKVEGKQQWGFKAVAGYAVVNEQGKLLEGAANKSSFYPATKRVSVGKKKVLKPYVP